MRPRLAFRVGTVGHRPNRLHSADLPKLTAVTGELLAEMRRQVESFLRENAGLFEGSAAELRVVSPLAEGSDRIVAEQALKLGYRLTCPMPFLEGEFERDFLPDKALEPNSIERFRELLRQGQGAGDLVRFEIEGTHAEAGIAYGAAGSIVLNQSDVLLAVWDGAPGHGAGGTTDTLDFALKYDIPVIWIDAAAPHAWQLLRGNLPPPKTDGTPLHPEGCGQLTDIANLIEHVLGAPDEASAPEHGHGRKKQSLRMQFYREEKPDSNYHFIWKAFRNLLGDGRFTRPSFKVIPFEDALQDDWSAEAPGVAGWANRCLRQQYAWADKLADYYGDGYRSAFVLAFALSAVAVACALGPFLLGEHTESPFIEAMAHGSQLSEIAVILFIFASISIAVRKRWQDRWMEYRLVAELVRQQRILLPLGGGRPFARVPLHISKGYGHLAQSWMFWHVRAISRTVGLPAIQVDRNYLTGALQYIRTIVRNQSDFHRTTAARSHRIEHRLHLAGVTSMLLTLLACLVHLLFHHGVFSRLLTFACAVLPAAGAALAGINNQGEFARISKRSAAMSARLDEIDNKIERLLTASKENGPVPPFSEVVGISNETAQLLVDEVSDWRVVFQDRPLVLPA